MLSKSFLHDIFFFQNYQDQTIEGILTFQIALVSFFDRELSAINKMIIYIKIKH